MDPFSQNDRLFFKTSQSYLVLTNDAIESPDLTGDRKIIRWTEIADIGTQRVNHKTLLKITLKDIPGQTTKRPWWRFGSAAQPTLDLTVYEKADREKILDEASARFSRVTRTWDSTAAPSQLAAEREFDKRMQSLAPHPWMIYALIAMNVLVFVGTLVLGANFMQIPADKLLRFGGNAASEVQRGQWWRLLSSMFLHGGIMHLLLNMYGLYVYGAVVERIYGKRLTALIYLGSGLMGSALSLHFSAQHAVSVGASGAVFGIAGALLVAVYQHREKLPKVFSSQMMGMGIYIVYALFQGFTNAGIDNAAHVGGMIGGGIIAYILPERFDMASFRASFSNRAVTAMAVACIGILGLAATAPKATVDIGRISETALLFERGSKRFDDAITAMQQLFQRSQAEKMTECDTANAARLSIAPMFKAAADDLSQVVLRANDPRTKLLEHSLHLSKLMHESFAMKTICESGNRKLIPANPARRTELQAEIVRTAKLLNQEVETLKKKRP